MLLVDRQLSGGGANYGNTIVLGRKTRPHVLPTAMCVVAFHRVDPTPEPIQESTNYLRGELLRPLGSVSLAWLIHALASAQSESTSDAMDRVDKPLREAISRTQITNPSAHRENLLLLATRIDQSPLLDLPATQWNNLKDETVS